MRNFLIGIAVVVVVGAGLMLAGGRVHVKLGGHHAGMEHAGHAGHHRRGGTERTIKVNGAAALLAAPDTAKLSVGVKTFSVESDKALNENNVRMASIIERLKSLGLTSDEIQTSGFSLRRLTDESKARPGHEDGFVGYNVSNSVHIYTKKISLIEEIMGRVIAFGATEVSSLRFSIEDDSEYMSIARASAVRDATRHAQELVYASGAELGEILRIEDGGSRYSTRRMPSGVRSDVLGPDVPVFLTTEIVVARVSVTFGIK